MKSALLSKIAMCVCPPAIVATSAITVPPIKRAVHRATAPSHMPAIAKARPHRVFTAAYDCTPGTTQALQGSPVQRLTDASPIPDVTPNVDVASPSLTNTIGPVAFTGPGFSATPVPFAIVPPLTIVPPVTNDVPSALPEASTWAMTIGGFAAVGIALRRRTPAATPAEKPDAA